MTKKRRNLRILASIIAAGCVWATGMGSVWAAEDANRGYSYEAKVALSVDENGKIGIVLYRGDRAETDAVKDKIASDPNYYMSDQDAQNDLGNEYNTQYKYKLITSSADTNFFSALDQEIIEQVRTMVTKGKNVYISGNGSQATPYVINAKDGYTVGVTHELVDGKLVSTLAGNEDMATVVSNSIELGGATINVDGTKTTIEQAINNNYNKIENIENNYVTNISQNTDQFTDINGNTYNIDYYSVTQNVTDNEGNTTQETFSFKDTTLVPKNLFGGISAAEVIANARYGHLGANSQEYQSELDRYKYGMSNNALAGYIDPLSGMPMIITEFQDTSGNLVQGALDIGTLFASAIDISHDENITISNQSSNPLSFHIELNERVINQKSITFNNGIRIGDYNDFSGIDMNNHKIINVQDGRIAPDSKDAINGSQLWETNRNMDKLGGRLDKVGAGAAALAALHPLDFDPDDKLQFSAGVGNYKGETAAALGAFYRPTEKVMFSVAGTMGNGENMVNAGVTFALDRKNNVSNSRVAMAHEIQDLRDQVAALTALVSQIAGKGNPLLDTVMFPDVPENHWAYDYVENLQKRGIIEGYPDGNFGGDRSMTRYEYAAMLYRALEKGFPVDGRLLKEFEAELGRIRIDRIKGADDDANKVERVRVNDYEDRDDYGSKLAQVVADAAPAIEEEPAA